MQGVGNSGPGNPSTGPQFGEVMQRLQDQYGEKPQKAREVKKTLGKDDFLRIMITQMKNQDPTNPFKAEQMATEIAQFTSVEQLQNVNQNLNKMATQNRPLEQMAMTNMIGKMVTVDRERFPHLEGQVDSLTFKLPKDAKEVKLAIISELGELTFEKDLGAQKAGDVNFSWDGLKSNTLPSKSGNYIYRIEAKDEKGIQIQINPKSRAKVIGVSFEGPEPVFLVGDAKHQDRVTIRNISQIEMESQPNGVATGAPQLGAGTPSGSSPNHGVSIPLPPQFGAGLAPGAAQGFPGTPTAASVGAPTAADPEASSESSDAPPTPPSTPNFFNFKRGVGSNKEIAPPQVALNPKLQDSITQPITADEKGFPNGLHDPDLIQTNSMKGGDGR